MPLLAEEVPELERQVVVTLANGESFVACWDGAQWWVDLDNSPNRIPVVNEYVVSWDHLTA